VRVGFLIQLVICIIGIGKQLELELETMDEKHSFIEKDGRERKEHG